MEADDVGNELFFSIISQCVSLLCS